MDGERTFLSYLDDFAERAQALLPARVAALIPSLDVTSPIEARTALQALEATDGPCPEGSFLLALAWLAEDHERPPEAIAASSDRLVQAVLNVRRLRSPEDFALFFVFATVRTYDAVGWAMSVREHAMRVVEERLHKLEELSCTLNVTSPALEALARAAGVSDEDSAALLSEACLVCDEAFTCAAAVAVSLAENLTRPTALSGAALAEWFAFPTDIEACAAAPMVDFGEHRLSGLIRPQTGLADLTRQAIEHTIARTECQM